MTSTFQKIIRRIKYRGADKVNRSRGVDFFLMLWLGLLGSFMLLPIIYTLVSAFKPMEELFIFPPRLYVANPTLDNFIQLKHILSGLWVPFSRYLFNSAFVTVLATTGNVIFASMAAYPLAKHEFPGKKIISQIVVLALLFTGQVLYIPQYVIIAKLGLINSYLALILPVVQGTLGVFLMKQFMTQIPVSLLEAARIDGGNEFFIWARVVMPSVKPAWLTLIIFSFKDIWNQPGNSFIYDESMKVLPSIMTQIQSGGFARAGVVAAVALVMMIPPLVLFQVTQKSVIQTMASSGIKE
jgi:ABC-type glycerol-3-phosphate transport system permease component